MLDTGEDCLVPMRRMETSSGLRCRPVQTKDINDTTWMRRIQNAFPCGAWGNEKIVKYRISNKEPQNDEVFTSTIDILYSIFYGS